MFKSLIAAGFLFVAVSAQSSTLPITCQGMLNKTEGFVINFNDGKTKSSASRVGAFYTISLYKQTPGILSMTTLETGIPSDWSTRSSGIPAQINSIHSEITLNIDMGECDDFHNQTACSVQYNEKTLKGFRACLGD